ncbi:hypothetical protein QO010_003377 [Caulobacter ginsengisoli]|uniref:Uncharacterized protein n=1 Tax=Caulobacter ginsengisoli TaxID=400775 RepID=A0ABU0IUA1_9CAUL|nr:hypothetical protein [Caulobacter ginsengisoli]MDQ0465588.1 hypothetical protein [Caulobacter ginsengisoli]
MRSIASRAALALALAAISVQAAHAAEPAAVLAKPGGSYDQRAADQATCKAIAAQAPAADLPGLSYSGAGGGVAYPDMATAAGGAIAMLIIAGIETNQARGRAVGLCLTNMGYTAVTLTPEEADAWRGLAGGRREAWERAFLATDLSGRIEAATRPSVPQLPPFREEPGTIGGVRVDMASLAATGGPVRKGEVLMTGRLARFRTAVLAQPFEGGGAIRVEAKAGTVFQLIDVRPQRSRWLRSQAATWCAQVNETTQGSTSPQNYCFYSLRDGYEAVRAQGRPWLWGGYGGIRVPNIAGPILLEERAGGDEAPIDFEVRLVAVSSRRIGVAVTARKGERAVGLQYRDLPLGADGKAVLPLWSRRLVITRTSATEATAVLDDQGDGQGWREGDA